MGFAGYYEDICQDRDRYGGNGTSPAVKFPCSYCNDEFVSREKLQFHVQNTHYPCPDCNEVCLTIDKLTQHIRLQHYPKYPILLVNDTVVGKEYVAEYPIRSIVFYPVDAVNGVLKLSGFTISEAAVSNKNGIVLTPYLPSNNGKYSVSLQYGSQWHYTVYQEPVEPITDKNVLYYTNKIKYRLLASEIIDWDQQSEFLSDCSANERTFAEGFYEYYFAVANEFDKLRDKEYHYEQAYEKLRRFVNVNQEAKIIAALICFHFNWINKLEKLCYELPNAVISHVCDWLTSNTAVAKGTYNRNNTKNNTVIDDADYAVMQVILDFAAGNGTVVKEYLDKSTGLTYNNPNVLDKIYLLNARYGRKFGNMQRRDIQDCYKRIRSPFYRKEAEEYLNER